MGRGRVCKSVLNGRVAFGWGVGVVGFVNVFLKDGWPLVGVWGRVYKSGFKGRVAFGRG